MSGVVLLQIKHSIEQLLRIDCIFLWAKKVSQHCSITHPLVHLMTQPTHNNIKLPHIMRRKVRRLLLLSFRNVRYDSFPSLQTNEDELHRFERFSCIWGERNVSANIFQVLLVKSHRNSIHILCDANLQITFFVEGSYYIVQLSFKKSN